MPIIKWPTKSWSLINPTRALGACFLDYPIGESNPAVLPARRRCVTVPIPRPERCAIHIVALGKIGGNRKEFEGPASCTFNR